MIHIHGADVTVHPRWIEIRRSPLAAALLGRRRVTVDLADVTGVRQVPPTPLTLGSVRLDGAGITLQVEPGHDAEFTQLVEAIAAARRGDSPGTVPGLSFVALDVETANENWGSICQIGAVRYRDGEATDALSLLCQPPVGGFAPENTAIHGITEDDVARAPSFAEVFPTIVEFLGSDPMVAHNVQFDATALARAARYIGHDLPEVDLGCSLALSRAARLNVADHRLSTVAAALGVSLTHHHDASADARACGDIVVTLGRRHPGSLFELLGAFGLTHGRLGPERVYPVLRSRPAASRKPAARPSRWQRVVAPDHIPAPNPEADPSDPLCGEHVTLSGDFQPFDKSELWAALAEHGATVGKNVTKKTTILAAGAWETKTSKQKRAEELRAKGQEIRIWSMGDLLDALGLEPPAS